MLRPLKSAVEARLEHTATHALASFPRLVALYPEDMWDAFEHVGLVFQRFIPWPVAMPDFAANYASQGLYMCSDFRNKTACEAEQLELALKNRASTFNFHLSKSALMLTVPSLAAPIFTSCLRINGGQTLI